MNLQSDIFQDDQRQQQFAEICNALYERELHSLSQQPFNNISLLQRKLAGLSAHIRKAAEYLLNNDTPIDVDVHNASWQSKQAASCPGHKLDINKTHEWFSQYASPGLPVVVMVEELGIQHLELDSIDRIDKAAGKLHLNKHRWFSLDGKQLGTTEQNPLHDAKWLLKPTKGTFSAACSGHRWNHRGRSQPRSISLRELMLSTKINWKNFR